jgi:hypothetical protein
MPIRLAFVDDSVGFGMILEITIDFLFMFDVAVNFCSAYYDDDNKLVVNRKLIMKKYMKGWMIIDLVASIPFNLVETLADTSSANDMLRIFRLPRLYRLLRITRIFKIFNYLKQSSMIKNI